MDSCSRSWGSDDHPSIGRPPAFAAVLEQVVAKVDRDVVVIQQALALRMLRKKNDGKLLLCDRWKRFAFFGRMILVRYRFKSNIINAPSKNTYVGINLSDKEAKEKCLKFRKPSIYCWMWSGQNSQSVCLK